MSCCFAKKLGKDKEKLEKDKEEVEKEKEKFEKDKEEAKKEKEKLEKDKEEVKKEKEKLEKDKEKLEKDKEKLEKDKEEAKKEKEEVKKDKDKVEKDKDKVEKDKELMKMYFRRDTVKLDPDTAHPKLLLKDNTVTHVDQWQDVPDNQHRFDSHLYVLGSKGFHSGNHCWIVEVGDKKEWDLGVASESAKRKGPITLSPSNGFWAIGLCNETDYWARSAPVIKLKITDKPKMIGVFLQYEAGQISFYNVENWSHLYTFSNDKFDGTLYPFFNPGFSSNENNSVALKIMNPNSL